MSTLLDLFVILTLLGGLRMMMEAFELWPDLPLPPFLALCMECSIPWSKVFIVIAIIVTIYAYYAYTVYLTWNERIAGNRYKRGNKLCPSNKDVPNVKSWESNRKSISLATGKCRTSLSSAKSFRSLMNATKPTKDTNPEIKRKMSRLNSMKSLSSTSTGIARRPSIVGMDDSRHYRLSLSSLALSLAASTNMMLSLTGTDQSNHNPRGSLSSMLSLPSLGLDLEDNSKFEQEDDELLLSEEKATSLDMDHVYITYLQFLWAHTFIGPNALYLWVTGIVKLMARQLLHRWGLIKLRFDPAELVGRLCLEGTMAIHFYSKTDDEIAGFYFTNFSIITMNGSMKMHDLFIVNIDLHTKKMVSAMLDDKPLTASEALILCWFNTISMNHVKLHAMANWGINHQEEQFQNDYFNARSSLVTAIYNYFGYTVFGTFFPLWSKMGLVALNCSQALNDCFDVGVKEGVWEHSGIRDLASSSNFVKFVIKTRAIFMNEFAKHKDRFPGIHGEAMFVGTVLHSLDHTLMDRNLDDPLYLDVNHPEFARMAEIGRIVKAGFVQDIPGLMFHHRFKKSGHPFYEAVYRKAAKIDKDLADNMDTCIIK